jgi:hypothetical protein
MYLVCEGAARACGKLPVPLQQCPVCYFIIEPARNMRYVNSDLLHLNKECGFGEKECEGCALRMRNTKMGLMWVGEAFYPTPEHFMRESGLMGVSKRIPQFPKNFVVGKTWVALAHRKCIPVALDGGGRDHEPGVFAVFLPTRIEYVVKSTDTEAKLDELEKKGFTLVRVIPDTHSPDLFGSYSPVKKLKKKKAKAKKKKPDQQ